MRQSIANFLKLMLVLFSFLLIVGVYFLATKSNTEIDGDSYLLAGLLTAISSLILIVIIIALRTLSKNNS